MKIFSIFTFFTILGLNACTPKGPTVFEVGIFNRDVGQVALNTKKIEKNTKECERNLEEAKAIEARIGVPETTQQASTPEVTSEDKPEDKIENKAEHKEQEKH